MTIFSTLECMTVNEEGREEEGGREGGRGRGDLLYMYVHVRT